MGETAQGRYGATGRAQLIAELYQEEAETIKQLVANRARVPEAVLEDACQTAWERLWSHPEVNLQRDAAMRWLVVTAIRQAWREARGESPAGRSPVELSDLAGESSNPLEVAVAHEHSRALAARLHRLSARERRFLGLQAAGLSYREIGRLTGSTVRTVERQVLRGRRKLWDDAEEVTSTPGEGGETNARVALITVRRNHPRFATLRPGLGR